ncbi:hypothetical protein APR04_003049 [Promicromonospora umidemergens]|uniref:Uncharacterized protein n=1 Tax=Promicromonospora umidemergens TaxID=629679 RepID=A0ABP8WF19_9MICO|nr:hypothetical protein [Promicromonospora umidemergens]MCP2284129.1 hypothetical protein [Promicromonospora umidemergens]
MRADHYDGFADSYAAENASSLLNTYYDKPAMLRLAGERAVLTFWHRPLHAMRDSASVS